MTTSLPFVTQIYRTRGTFDAGIENAVRFILTSPHFLFREGRLRGFFFLQLLEDGQFDRLHGTPRNRISEL